MHEQQTAAKLADRVKAMGYEVTTDRSGNFLAGNTVAGRFMCRTRPRTEFGLTTGCLPSMLSRIDS
jgi:hypothetical protein